MSTPITIAVQLALIASLRGLRAHFRRSEGTCHFCLTAPPNITRQDTTFVVDLLSFGYSKLNNQYTKRVKIDPDENMVVNTASLLSESTMSGPTLAMNVMRLLLNTMIGALASGWVISTTRTPHSDTKHNLTLRLVAHANTPVVAEVLDLANGQDWKVARTVGGYTCTKSELMHAKERISIVDVVMVAVQREKWRLCGSRDKSASMYYF